MNNNKIKSKNFEEGERYKEGKKIVGEDKGEEDNNAKEISASLVAVPYVLLVYLAGSTPLSNLGLTLLLTNF